MIDRAAVGRIQSCRANRMRVPVVVKVSTVSKNLQFLVLLIKRELITAPTAPNKMRATADSEIMRSLSPKGLMRRFEVDPKIKNVPQKREQPVKNFHRFRSSLNFENVSLIVSQSFLSILVGGTIGFDFIRSELAMSMTSVAIAYPKYKEYIYFLAMSPSLAQFTKTVGIANPTPDPMILVPTRIEVAITLCIAHFFTFSGKNQYVAILAGILVMKGCPIAKNIFPIMRKGNPWLIRQQIEMPIKYSKFPTINPNLIPLRSMM